MKQQLTEIKKMQQLAGIIKEDQFDTANNVMAVISQLLEMGSEGQRVLSILERIPEWNELVRDNQDIKEIKRMQQLAGINKENEYIPKYSEKDAFKLFDYHERTGMLPNDITAEEYDELMSYYGIKRNMYGDNDDDFTDPGGGSGIYSHI